MSEARLERSWMRNKDFYLGILDEISACMEQLDISVEDLSLASGLEQRRLNHIFAGMIEDLTLLELDNMLIAVKATPKIFAVERLNPCNGAIEQAR